MKTNLFLRLKQNMEKNQKERDTTGNIPGAKPLKGTYAEYRSDKLGEWRKKFNVDQNGFFKGGGILIFYFSSPKTSKRKCKRRFIRRTRSV